MNDSIYENYMRSVLGYRSTNFQNTYEYDINYDDYNLMCNDFSFINTQNEEIENCYPDIYKLVYPMIQKACINNTKPMNRELIDELTNEVYFAIEDNEIGENRGEKNKNENNKDKEDRSIQIKNRTLNDLIRILILREILGNNHIHHRPQRPRPPYPPQNRPPMRPPMPRDIQSSELFEEDYNF